MRVLDLFCGRWGWSRAFAARSWLCFGIDLVESPKPSEFPQRYSFTKADVLWLTVEKIKSEGFDFIVASSPCEEFSTLRNFRPPVPYPEMGIKLFNHTRSICEASGIPYVMENVAGAQKFVGRSDANCGAYHLWGNGIPPLIPKGIRKGLTELAMGLREHKGKPGWDDRHGSKGQTPTALVATIPPELANCVADYAERICAEKVPALAARQPL